MRLGGLLRDGVENKSQGGEPSLGRLQECAKDSLAWISLCEIDGTSWFPRRVAGARAGAVPPQ